jgi:uncharacterized protein (DUF433 family)
MIAEETEKIATDGVLLWQDKSGALRIGNTRVLLYLVLDAYNRGWTPEQIQEAYISLSLADVYTVIGHYLRNKEKLDAYLAEGERKTAENWRRIEALQGDHQEKCAAASSLI